MIARVWHGWAPAASADAYQAHFEGEVSGNLRALPGFVAARLLRRDDGGDDGEVEFTAVTFFTSLDAVHGFAGADVERAHVEEAGRAALTRWDDRAVHHQVAVAVG